MSYRVLFFGSASFSLPLLGGLTRDPRFTVIGVVTQPDRRTGRQGALTASPTKKAAYELGLPVFQFESVKDTHVIDELRQLRPDILAVASFGQIMPPALLAAAPRGALNFHWSLLPKYRGASPVQAAIVNGDTLTGATIILMDDKMDHGPILAQFTETLRPDDTADDVYHRLGSLGAQLFQDTLADQLEGAAVATPQAHDQATFVKLLTREDGRLDPEKTAAELERRVRAYQPWPGAFLDWHGQRLKIFTAQPGSQTKHSPGTIFSSDDRPCLACGQGTSLALLELQPEGKSRMDGKAFLRGYSAKIPISP